MTLPHKINLPTPDLRCERNYRVSHNYIILGLDFIQFNYQYKAEVQDENTELWEDTIAFQVYKVKKASISGIKYRYYTKADVFAIEIDCTGIGDTITFCFADKKEGQEIFDIIDKWLYS